jgi:hypothetical protein
VTQSVTNRAIHAHECVPRLAFLGHFWEKTAKCQLENVLGVGPLKNPPICGGACHGPLAVLQGELDVPHSQVLDKFVELQLVRIGARGIASVGNVRMHVPRSVIFLLAKKHNN